MKIYVHIVFHLYMSCKERTYTDLSFLWSLPECFGSILPAIFDVACHVRRYQKNGDGFHITRRLWCLDFETSPHIFAEKLENESIKAGR